MRKGKTDLAQRRKDAEKGVSGEDKGSAECGKGKGERQMHIFTYGTLMFPEVMVALTGREFPWEDIAVPGFDRRTLAGRIYPGLFEAPGRHVEGRLYLDVDAASMAVLEAFEDGFYERRRIAVCSRERGWVMALAYVIPHGCLHLLSDKDWDPVAFRLRHLQAWIEMCHQFRTDMRRR